MATKDLLEGFKTGFNTFQPLMASKMRMKELKATQAHQTSERKDTQKYKTGEREGAQSFALDLSNIKHQDAKELQQDMFAHKEGESKLERGVRLKTLKDTLAQQKKEAGKDRALKKKISKLERKTRKEIAKNSEEGSTLRAQIESATRVGTEAMRQAGATSRQKTGIAADEDTQTREFGQRSKEIGERKDAEQSLLDHKAHLQKTQFGRTTDSVGELTTELLKLNQKLGDPTQMGAMTEDQRTETYARAHTLHGMLTRLNSQAHHMAKDQNTDGQQVTSSWLDTGTGPSPGGFGVPGVADRPRSTGYGSDALSTVYGAGLNTPDGRAAAVGNVLGGAPLQPAPNNAFQNQRR